MPAGQHHRASHPASLAPRVNQTREKGNLQFWRLQPEIPNAAECELRSSVCNGPQLASGAAAQNAANGVDCQPRRVAPARALEGSAIDSSGCAAAVCVGAAQAWAWRRQSARGAPPAHSEGIPLLPCAVEGILIDVAADARPGARAVHHGRMVFGRAPRSDSPSTRRWKDSPRRNRRSYR